MTRPSREVLTDLAAADAELARWHSRRSDLQRELACALAAPPARPAPASARFLTTREASARLGVSVRTLEALRAEGRGPAHIRVGRAVRYPADTLAAYKSEPAVKGSAPRRV